MKIISLFAMLVSSIALAQEVSSRWTLSGNVLTDNLLGNQYNVTIKENELTYTGHKAWGSDAQNPNKIVDWSTLDGSDPSFEYKLVSIGAKGNNLMREMYLPDTLRTITVGDAFSGCKSLTTVYPFLPKSMGTMSGFVFQEVATLTNDVCIINENGISMGKVGDKTKTFEKNKIGNAYFVNFDGALPQISFGCATLTNMYFIGKIPLPAQFNKEAFYTWSPFVQVTTPRFLVDEALIAGLTANPSSGFTTEMTDAERGTTYNGATPVGVFIENAIRHLVYTIDPLALAGRVEVYCDGEEKIGFPRPTYGLNLAVNEGKVLSAGGFAIAGKEGKFSYKDGVLYRASGYTLEEYNSATKKYVTTENSTADTYIYSDASKSIRITWKFTPVAYQLKINESHITSSLPTPYWTHPTTLVKYFPIGTTLSLTANENDGEKFPFMDIADENGRTITTSRSYGFALNEPTAIYMRYAMRFTVDPEETTKGTLEDSLGAKFEVTIVSLDERTLNVGAKVSESSDYRYDLSKVILDADGNSWTIKMFKGLGYTTYTGGAFRQDTNVREIILPHEITFTPGVFINGCSSLEKVVMDCPNLTTIGSSSSGGDNRDAFCGCPKLKTIIPFLPPSVNYISSFTFQSSKVENDLYLTNGVITVGEKAFEETNFKFADLSGVIDIPNSMFGRTGANKETVPLKKVIFSPEIKSIAYDAFALAPELKEAYFVGQMPKTYENNPFGGVSYSVNFFASLEQVGELNSENITGYSELTAADAQHYLERKTPLFALELNGARYIVYKYRSPLDRKQGFYIIVK